jgi:ribosomal protein S11
MTAVRKPRERANHYPTKAAVKRAVETARELGLTVVGVEVSKEGVIKILDQAAIPQKPKDEFEEWLANGKLG